MTKKKEPCSICEAYIEGVECDLDGCPVHEMKEENKKLKKQISSLKKEVSRLKSNESWEREIRSGSVQGMW